MVKNVIFGDVYLDSTRRIRITYDYLRESVRYREKSALVEGRMLYKPALSLREFTELAFKNEILDYYNSLIKQNSGGNIVSHDEILCQVVRRYNGFGKPIEPLDIPERPCRVNFDKEQIIDIIEKGRGRFLVDEYNSSNGMLRKTLNQFAHSHGYQGINAGTAYLRSLSREDKNKFGSAVVDTFKKKYVESGGKLKVTDFCRKYGNISTSTFYRFVNNEVEGGISSLRHELNSMINGENEKRKLEKTVYLSENNSSNGPIYRLIRRAKAAAVIAILVGSSFFGSHSEPNHNYETLDNIVPEYVIENQDEESLENMVEEPPQN